MTLDRHSAPAAVAQVTEILLDVVKIQSAQEVSAYTIESMELEVFARHMVDTFVFDLRAEMLGHNEQVICWPVQEVRPASWWEHFKQRHFPRWAERRWPVKLRRSVRQLEIPVTILFPEADVPRQLGRPRIVVADDFAHPLRPSVTGGPF
jgi:hypothetical protein